MPHEHLFMNILQLCKKSPYPANDGESIAILQISKGLVDQGHHVYVLAMNTPKHYCPAEAYPDDLKSIISFYLVDHDTSIKMYKAFLNLLSLKPYHIVRFDSNKYREKLIEILKEKQFDIIQAEGIHLAIYLQTIRKYSRAKIVLRSHNVEHIIWQRIAVNTQNPLKKIYLKIQTKRLKRFELQAINQFDGIASISPTDSSYFQSNGCSRPLANILPGLNIKDYPLNIIRQAVEDCCIFGALDWIPNQEGLSWFVHHVWPLLRKQEKQVKLLIAGRNAPEWIKEFNGNGIQFLGEIDQASSFYSDHALFLIPLLSGSGIKIKIIEALAYGKTVIATSLALEGTGLEAGVHVLQADDKQSFADAISICLHQNELRIKLAEAGSKFVRDEYSIQKIMQQLNHFYKSLLNAV